MNIKTRKRLQQTILTTKASELLKNIIQGCLLNKINKEIFTLLNTRNRIPLYNLYPYTPSIISNISKYMEEKHPRRKLIREQDILKIYGQEQHLFYFTQIMFFGDIPIHNYSDDNKNDQTRMVSFYSLLKKLNIYINDTNKIARAQFLLCHMALKVKITKINNNLCDVIYPTFMGPLNITSVVIPKSISIKVGDEAIFHLGYIASKLHKRIREQADKNHDFQQNNTFIVKAIKEIIRHDNSLIGLRHFCKSNKGSCNLTNIQNYNYNT